VWRCVCTVMRMWEKTSLEERQINTVGSPTAARARAAPWRRCC
jgi:hypothetical protein